MKDLYHANELRPCMPLSFAKCVEDAWLGEGYYFWESFIENARLWGESHYIKKGKAFQILKSQYDSCSENCLDLVDNVEQIREFDSACKEVEATASEKVEFFFTRLLLLKKYAANYFSKFFCIRILPMGGMAVERLRFSEKNSAIYTPYPPIQVCFWEKPPQIISCVERKRPPFRTSYVSY